MDEKELEMAKKHYEEGICPVVRDWQHVRERMLRAADKIDQIQTGITDISKYIEHLQQLDQIATILSTLADRLVVSATDKKPFQKMFIIVITLLAFVIFAVLYRDSVKNFHLGGQQGLHIEGDDYHDSNRFVPQPSSKP